MGEYARYCALLEGAPLPAALVDLDAVDANADALLAPLAGTTKTLRLATKSLRAVALLRYLQARGGPRIRGLMAYSVAEAAFLVGQGFSDIVVAYPTARASDASLLADISERADVSVVVDDPEQLAVLAAPGAPVGVVIELDVSLRLGSLHVGARRSPLRTPLDVLALARALGRYPQLRLRGLMAYESQVAGLPDRSPYARGRNGPIRALKQLSRGPVARARAAAVAALRAEGLEVPVVNGGGSGSLAWSASDPSLTEVTAGSGFLDSHLFDYYRDLQLRPAAVFALQVVRRPAADLVTCHGGGLVASGAPGPDRLPVPYLPEGLRLLAAEGAGEVQTPVRVPAGLHLELGAPVIFRHAKAGELAERFDHYLLVRGDRVVERVPTYRGQGGCFG